MGQFNTWKIIAAMPLKHYLSKASTLGNARVVILDSSWTFQAQICWKAQWSSQIASLLWLFGLMQKEHIIVFA